MSYRKDQGRYARMVAFWGVVLLVGYGCFHGGGLATVLDGWLGDANTTYVDPFPLLGTLKTSTLIAIGALAVVGFLAHRVFNAPRLADVLIETEEEMHKVTWPTWQETWSGTMAVAGMVLVLFLFLTVVDVVLLQVMSSLWGGGS
ncbi:MAG: preprotein translocase subunit SecE [Planctomycetota bacterium]